MPLVSRYTASTSFSSAAAIRSSAIVMRMSSGGKAQVVNVAQGGSVGQIWGGDLTCPQLAHITLAWLASVDTSLVSLFSLTRQHLHKFRIVSQDLQQAMRQRIYQALVFCHLAVSRMVQRHVDDLVE